MRRVCANSDTMGAWTQWLIIKHHALTSHSVLGILHTNNDMVWKWNDWIIDTSDMTQLRAWVCVVSLVESIKTKTNMVDGLFARSMGT